MHFSWELQQPCIDKLGKPYIQGDGRFGPLGYDCSGYGCRVIHDVTGDWPPFSASADAAQYAEDHPVYRLEPRIAALIPFTIGIAGGVNGWGNDGHFWFWGPNGLTYESRGGAGVSRVPHAQRLSIASHSLYIPGISYQVLGDDDMFTDDDRRCIKNIEATLLNGSKPGVLHDLAQHNAERNTFAAATPAMPHLGEAFRITDLHSEMSKDKGRLRRLADHFGIK